MKSNRDHSVLSWIGFWLLAGLIFLLWENLSAAFMNNYNLEIRRTFWGVIYYPVLFLVYGIVVELVTLIIGRIFRFQSWAGQRYVWMMVLLAAIIWGDMSRHMLMEWFQVGQGRKGYAANLLFISLFPLAGFIVNWMMARRAQANRLPSLLAQRTVFLAGILFMILSNKVTYRYFQYEMLDSANLLLQPILLLTAIVAGYLLSRLFTTRTSLRFALLIVPILGSIIVVGLSAAFKSHPTFPPVQSASKPNIVVLLFDALRGDHIGPDENGNSLTPTLDSLALQGRTYSDAYSISSWTFPSVVGLLTARYPNKLGLLQRVRLPDNLTTLPGLLEQQGYYTACISANGLLSPTFGFDQYFNELHTSRGTGPKQMFMPFRSFFPTPRFFDEISYQFGFIGTDLFSGDWRELNDMATDILPKAQEQPLFLYIHYIEPHSPYWAKPFHKSLLDLEEIRRVFYQPVIMGMELKGILDVNDPLFKEHGWALIKTHHDRYREGVEVADQATAQILQLLDEQGIGDNTVVFVIADHGDGFFEHRKTGHGHSLYREQTCIPFIVHVPDALKFDLPLQPDGVSIVDVTPTVLEMAGSGEIADADGKSLLHPYSESPRARFMFLETEASDFFWSAVVSTPYKLMMRETYETATIDTFLFNLATDPGETVNLYPDQKEIADSLALMIQEQLEQSVEPVDERLKNLSPAELQRLRALGYVN